MDYRNSSAKHKKQVIEPAFVLDHINIGDHKIPKISLLRRFGVDHCIEIRANTLPLPYLSGDRRQKYRGKLLILGIFQKLADKISIRNITISVESHYIKKLLLKKK